MLSGQPLKGLQQSFISYRSPTIDSMGAATVNRQIDFHNRFAEHFVSMFVVI